MTRLPLPSLPSLPQPVRDVPATPAPLSNRHQVVGKQVLVRHAAINGLAFPMLTGGVIIALVSQYNPSHTTLAVVGALPVWTMAAQLLCGWLLRGRDLVHSAAALWLWRGLFLLPLFAAPWLAAHAGPEAALWAIVLGYGGFCVMRALALAVVPSILHPLGNATTFGRVQGQINRYVWLSAMAATAAGFAVMKYGQLGAAGNVLLLVAVGLMFNSASALQMRRVPLRSGIRQYRASATFVELWRLMRSPRMRPTLLIGSIGGLIVVCMSMAANYGVKERGWDGASLLLMQLLCCFALYLANRVATPLVDRLGTKRSLWLGHGVVGVSMLALAGAAQWVPDWGVFAAVAVAHMGFWFVLLAAGRVVLTDAPDGPDKIVYQSAISVVGTVVAIGLGVGLGRLCDLIERAEWITGVAPIGHTYTPAFLAGAVVVLIGQLAVLRQRDHA